MKKTCPMTAVTAVVSVSLVPKILAAEAFRPARASLQQELHSATGRLSRRLRRLLNNWVAAAIAHREQQATLSVLRSRSDAELKGFGIYRGGLGRAHDRRRGNELVARR